MASQQHFTLSPSYSGPMVIAETLRKMKSNSGLNRMLSTFNKRFFVLDLNHATFYYLPDRQSHFANATDIPLSSIISIKVTKQAEGLEEDKIWKYEFVITTKKKNLELITDSKATMDKILFAFSNLINTKTNRSLFNWNHYTGVQQSQPASSTLQTIKSPEASPRNQKEEALTSPEESPVEVKTLQPEQRGEISPALTKIERVEKEEQAEQPSPDRQSTGSDDQKENNEDAGQKKYAPMQFRRKGNSFAAARGKGFAVEQKPAQEEVVSPLKKEQEQEREEQFEVMKKSVSPVKKGEKIQIKVELLNLDKVESEQKREQSGGIVSSREVPKKYNPGEQAVRRGSSRLVMSNKSASMKNMVSPPTEFTGCNQTEVFQPRNKTIMNLAHQSLALSSRSDDDRRVGFGTGVAHEASKFSLFKKSESDVNANMVGVKKSAGNDDDWDNEMFGDAKHQLSPLKPKNHEEKQRQPYAYEKSDKKSQLSQRRSEFVAVRQGTHNDWDDEL